MEVSSLWKRLLEATELKGNDNITITIININMEATELKGNDNITITSDGQ